MPHVLRGVDQVIVEQLAGLGLLEWQVVFHDDALHEVLVDDLAVSLPDFAVVRDQDVVAAGDQVVRHVAMWAVAVDAGFLVDELLDELSVGEDDGGGWAKFEGEYAPVGLSWIG